MSNKSQKQQTVRFIQVSAKTPEQFAQELQQANITGGNAVGLFVAESQKNPDRFILIATDGIPTPNSVADVVPSFNPQGYLAITALELALLADQDEAAQHLMLNIGARQGLDINALVNDTEVLAAIAAVAEQFHQAELLTSASSCLLPLSEMVVEQLKYVTMILNGAHNYTRTALQDRIPMLNVLNLDENFGDGDTIRARQIPNGEAFNGVLVTRGKTAGCIPADTAVMNAMENRVTGISPRIIGTFQESVAFLDKVTMVMVDGGKFTRQFGVITTPSGSLSNTGEQGIEANLSLDVVVRQEGGLCINWSRRFNVIEGAQVGAVAGTRGQLKAIVQRTDNGIRVQYGAGRQSPVAEYAGAGY